MFLRNLAKKHKRFLMTDLYFGLGSLRGVITRVGWLLRMGHEIPTVSKYASMYCQFYMRDASISVLNLVKVAIKAWMLTIVSDRWSFTR